MHYIITWFSVCNSEFATHHMEAHILRTPQRNLRSNKMDTFDLQISWEENHDAVAADGGWWWRVKDERWWGEKMNDFHVVD